MDKETEAFAAKVLLSIQQASRGEFARVHTPEDIAAYKARGRPVGSTRPDAKQAMKLRLDPPTCWRRCARRAGVGRHA